MFVNYYFLVKNKDDLGWYFFRSQYKFSIINDSPTSNRLWKNKYISIGGFIKVGWDHPRSWCATSNFSFFCEFLIYLLILILNIEFFVIASSCNSQLLVSEIFRAKLKKIGNKDNNFQYVKKLLSKKFLKDSLLWKYVAIIFLVRHYIWSLKVLYRSYRYVDYVELTPKKLPFAESSMSRLIVKLPTAKEIELRWKSNLEKKKWELVALRPEVSQGVGITLVEIVSILPPTKKSRASKKKRVLSEAIVVDTTFGHSSVTLSEILEEGAVSSYDPKNIEICTTSDI